MAAQNMQKTEIISKRKMQKRIKKLEAEECKYNQIKAPTNIAFNIILTPFLSRLSLSLSSRLRTRLHWQ